MAKTFESYVIYVGGGGAIFFFFLNSDDIENQYNEQGFKHKFQSSTIKSTSWVFKETF